MAILLVVLFFNVFVSCSAVTGVDSFTPEDNILVDCGADSPPEVPDGRKFKTDKEASEYLKTKNDVPSSIYLNAKVFPEEATYSFTLKRPGYHWVISVPDSLIADEGTSLLSVDRFSGLTRHGYQVVYRINMGGPLITSKNDTLGRTWIPDTTYLEDKNLAKEASTLLNSIRFPSAVTQLIAPTIIYLTLTEMADVYISTNVSWKFDIDRAFDYLHRMHFSDIVSKALNDLYFNVYINDTVVNASLFGDVLKVQVGPLNHINRKSNAILNGLEVMKMSNSADSLDGEHGVVGGDSELSHKGTVVVIVFAMAFGAFVGLGAMVYKWKKIPQDWHKRNSFSNWLLPLHVGHNNSPLNRGNGSKKSNTCTGLGRYFTLVELQEATNNFDSCAIIGVGGFGNVYLGTIDEGTRVAVKRGNPQSEQGINEFQTELQMLSKAQTLGVTNRDHLYGKNLPPLSWTQRLQICFGAARGLHYLHTGTAQGIIHRDVKTTNILLDDAFVAKVADFGLSKDTPMGQTHFSTAVKGSFGYLDPEYFRSQQLTKKSDVYSFGVVLLESLCARPAIIPQLPREQVNLADWARQWKQKDLLEEVVDPHLAGSINPESTKKFAAAAEKCLAEYGVDSPSMGDVLWNFEYALQLQEAFTEGMTEDEAKLSDASITSQPSILVSSASPPIDNNQEDKGPGEVQAIDDHSENAMFAQFQSLNGR
ncbi:putative receptor-like protein kinase [Hibiscus syriacus]|uniref:Receptor-like protein kinase n=1 Tax=Hibiscus syriacus TaxID=106335 RepID=A0A6A3BLD7_HIBSY|nr:putative receptor-like protein kinase [Hibiscus syriacus]